MHRIFRLSNNSWDIPYKVAKPKSSDVGSQLAAVAARGQPRRSGACGDDAERIHESCLLYPRRRFEESRQIVI